MEIKFKIYKNYIKITLFDKETKDISTESITALILQECNKRKLKKVLVDASMYNEYFNTTEIYYKAKKFAQNFSGTDIQISIIGNKKFVDPVPFFETAALNRGANIKVFTDIKEAKEWLFKNN